MRLQHSAQLGGERTGNRWSVGGPLPQIAERTGKRTFSADQKRGQGTLDLSARPTLVFDHRSVRGIGIELRLRRTKTADTAVGLGSGHTALACSDSKWRR